jgi:hypothetical protein
VSVFDDGELDSNLDEKISVKLRIPEDYTLNGQINGSLIHCEGQVGRKLRSQPFSLSILGQAHQLVLGNVQTEKISI